ncbi:MAG TPA: glycosyltransferase, partial [Flavisolibacter sp.]|nr:glycosyltransferase [Flavisolibacter sp.]
RIVLLNQSNKGIAAALNNGLARATSDLIARFDADDICYPHRLAKQYRYFNDHPACVIAGSSADYIDENGLYVFTSYPPGFTTDSIRQAATRICPFIHSSVMFRKAIVQQQGGYNEQAHSFEDHLLWQLVLQQGEACNCREPLIQVRLNAASITVDEQWRPKRFHRIKKKVLKEKKISVEQGLQLNSILQQQQNPALKESAYYALLAKKFLWNNHQPQKARSNLQKVMVRKPLHWRSYCFYALSFLPCAVLQSGYRLLKSPAFFFTPQRQNHG